MRTLRATRLDTLVLVVYRGLAAGDAAAALEGVSGAETVWFENKPRIGPVMEAVDRVAQRTG